MAKAEKKILGILPKSLANVMLVGLALTVIVALIWSWVQFQDFSLENSWVMIVEMLALAVLVGVIVGALAGDAKPVTLWVAAGLAIVGTVLAQALIEKTVEAAMMGSEAGVDDTILGSLSTEAFSLSASIGYVILAVVAAASVSLGNKIKL